MATGVESRDLNIFVGYASDAEKLAQLVRSMESQLQAHLDLVQHAIKDEKPFDRVRIFAWQEDAKLTVGGQAAKIDPTIHGSPIAVFPFVGRVGDMTKREFDDFRDSSHRRHVLALFPESPPSNMSDPATAKLWSDLQDFRIGLTADWGKEGSRSVTPIRLYSSPEDFSRLVLDRLKDAVLQVMKDAHERDSAHPQQERLSSSRTQIARPQFSLDAPSEVRLDALDRDIVSAFREELRSEIARRFPESLDEVEFIRRAQLASGDFLTNLGVLLFTSMPSMHLPHARLQCSAWKGEKIGLERDRLMVNDPVQIQIEKACQFIDQRISRSERRLESTPRTEELVQYSSLAVREIVANAVVHRDYSDLGRNVHVRLFSNRIEIVSPGTWDRAAAAGATSRPIPLASVAGASNKRNPKLALWIIASRLAEGEGSGIRVATEDSERIDAPEPTVFLADDTVTVTLYPSEEFATDFHRGDIDFPQGLRVQGTLKARLVTDDGTPATVVMRTATYFVDAELRFRGELDQLTQLRESAWQLRAFAESVGPGPEALIGQAVVPMAEERAGRLRTRVPISFGNDTLGPSGDSPSSNVLKLVLVVQHTAQGISGFVDLGLVQFASG